jgi:hypothetical protein
MTTPKNENNIAISVHEIPIHAAAAASKCKIFGGWPRDKIRGETPKDIDVLCSNPMGFIDQLLRQNGVYVSSLQRREGYASSDDLPDVTYKMSVMVKNKEVKVDVVSAATYDAHQTCNALVYDPETKTLESGVAHVSLNKIVADVKAKRCSALRAWTSDMTRMSNKGWSLDQFYYHHYHQK